MLATFLFLLPVLCFFLWATWATIASANDHIQKQISEWDKIDWCVGPLDRTRRPTCQNPKTAPSQTKSNRLARRQHLYAIYDRQWQDLAEFEILLSGIDLGVGHDAEFIIDQHTAFNPEPGAYKAFHTVNRPLPDGSALIDGIRV